MLAFAPTVSSRFGRVFKWGLLAFVIGAVTLVVGQASPPLIQLATEPLYMNGAKAKANLTLALSVEFPTVGQTYRDEFDKTKEYVGYFDPKSCYKHVPGGGAKGAYFDWSGAPNSSGSCGGGGFNGNFLNWATSSAIDIMRYGLTGGNRTTDESTGNGLTIVDRAWLPDNFYRNSAYFSEKVLPNALVSQMIETSVANKVGTSDMYIYNCRDRVYFAKARDTTGGCTDPFGVANAQSSNLVGPNNNDTYYEVRGVVCDPNSATNRLMTYDPQTRKWSGLCYRYPNGKYKPVGQFQVNAENLRVAVFGYLQDDNRTRYGGVLRAPLKYLGPKKYDNSFNLDTAANALREWDADSGVFIVNPQSTDATYGDQGYPSSGAIMYINKFGTLNPASIGKYKELDPVSELYYEAIRYLQGKQPTSNAVSGFNGTAAAVRALKDNFPAYSTWTDPFAGFTDSTGTGNSCLRNSILTIADVFTHSDRSVPGNAVTTNNDFARSIESNPTLNVPFWTSVVGSFESKTTATSAVTYTDSQGRAQVAGNLTTNTLYPALVDAATMDTGATGGSHNLAGLAYWANTQSFRSDFSKARVKTYSIDVNQSRASDTVDFRRTRQLYLAAKYGGFDDNVAGKTGSPYSVGSNVLWQATDGDAKNYFLVSDAAKFLDSLSEVFARVVEETGSIAGGAVSTTQLKSSEAGAVFQARFNPVANFWSGRVLKYPISLASGNTIVVGSTPTWEAGQVMTTTANSDAGSSRNIVIGSPIGLQGTVAPTPFQWTQLGTAHQASLNSMPNGTTDTLGEKRLQYLRGKRSDELSAINPLGVFRPRDIILGDVVNSGLVYMGKPSSSTSGAAFRTFYEANKGRKPVVFVNANDGMLHAFYDQNGAEAFAYIPGFLAGKLNGLPDLDYTHATLADATPAVGDAYFRGAWRTALVSGVGGGAQGVYALDVSNPETFSKNNVLWEFTDRDHPAMGNVLGPPQILKFRVQAGGTASPTFKWFAVVASGVNNYAPDGYAHAGGNPSLFFLDLDFVPSSTQGWVEGTNFWRIELPQTSMAMAKGVVGLTQVKNFVTSAVDALYTGDLQGNLWKFDFSQVGSTSLGANAAANFSAFNGLTLDRALYVARASDGSSLQPITGTPEIVNSYFGKKMVAFGTGKFLETADTSVPLAPTATFYAVLDDPFILGGVAGRASLQVGTVAASGTITVPAFTLGAPPTITPNVKSGFYFDFNSAIAERQISDITMVAGKLLFGSIYPTRGSCGEGGGRLYVLDALTGNGFSEESEVGILAPPLVLTLGDAGLGKSDTTGQRTATETFGVINQGQKGLKASNITGTLSYQTGRISWRQINNYQAIKAKP